MLGETERACRQATDYGDDIYGHLVDDPPAEEYPICLNRSLIPSHLDREIDEIGVGTCVACSYTRTDEVAEDFAMLRALGRALGS